MAMTGAYVLAEELRIAGDAVADALRCYERKLKPSIEEKQAAGRRLARWFVPEDRLHLVIRDTALRVITAPVISDVVRRRFSLASAVKF